MEKKLNKKRVVTAAVLAGLLLVIGISALVSYFLINKGTFDANRFVDWVNAGEYRRAYSMCSSTAKAEYSQDDFQKLYDESLATLRVKKIRIENAQLVSRGANQYISCDMIYESSHFGELKERLDLSLTQDGSKLNWSPSCFLSDMQPGDSIKVTTTQGKRGEIFSAGGTLLVANSFAVTVYAEPSKIPEESAFAQALSGLIAMSPEQILEILHSPETQRDQLAIFKSYLPNEFDHKSSQSILNIPGANIDTERLVPLRSYPEYAKGLNLAHILGYTSIVSQEDLKNNPQLTQGSLVGKEGIEKIYDEKLQPQTGYQVFISGSDLRMKKVLYAIEPKNGYDVHLTIDVGIQKQVEASMALNMLEGQRGCAIVLDSKTGDVDALASFPTFDPNIFLKGVSNDAWSKLNDPKGGQPLFNRAIYGQYPPGSTVKPFTMATGMAAGAVDKSYVFAGKVEDNKWKPEYINNWIWPPITRYKNHNTAMNLTNSMMYSDNIYFADVALKTGQEKFVQSMEQFGFSSALPFQLPVAPSQLINTNTQWNYKLLADTGYGQGEFLTSPLQLAASYSVFQNKGKVVQPNLVRALYETDKKSYSLVEQSAVKFARENTMNESSISALEETLRQTTLSGTGKGVYLEQLALYGKTGTAEVGAEKEIEISWYVGYTKNPDKIILTMIECNPKEGSAIKNHIVKDALYALLKKPLQPKIKEIPKETSD